MPTAQVTPVLVRKLIEDERPSSHAACTDVLYDNKGYAHHRIRAGRVVPHGQAHADESTIVRLSKAAGDQILWVGDDTLEVVRIEYIGPRKNGKHPGHGVSHGIAGGYEEPSEAHDHTPGTPAGTSATPFRSFDQPLETLRGRIIASGPADPKAAEGFYKVTFRVGGLEVDPDFEIGP
jgi:hypothetical protein